MVAELVPGWTGSVAELRAAMTSGSLSSARDTSSRLRSQSRLMATTCALRLTTTWFFSTSMPAASTRSLCCPIPTFSTAMPSSFVLTALSRASSTQTGTPTSGFFLS